MTEDCQPLHGYKIFQLVKHASSQDPISGCKSVHVPDIWCPQPWSRLHTDWSCYYLSVQDIKSNPAHGSQGHQTREEGFLEELHEVVDPLTREVWIWMIPSIKSDDSKHLMYSLNCRCDQKIPQIRNVLPSPSNMLLAWSKGMHTEPSKETLHWPCVNLIYVVL